MSGYEISMFISDMKDFRCFICTDVYREPMKLSCGHYLCKYCGEIEMAFGRRCPFCRSPIISMELDETMVYNIGSSLVHCPNEFFGCATNISLIGLDTHLEYECAHIPVSCSNGCGYRAVTMTGHSLQDCVNGLRVLLQNCQNEALCKVRLADQRQQEIQRLIKITDEISGERDFAFEVVQEYRLEINQMIDDDTEREETIAELEEQVNLLEEDNKKLQDQRLTSHVQ